MGDAGKNLRAFPRTGHDDLGAERSLVGPTKTAPAPAVGNERLECKINQILETLRRVVEKAADTATAIVEPLENSTTLTKLEVARHLKISQRTVDRLRAAGHDLGEMRIGAVVRFDPAKIQKIIANKKIKRRRQ